MAEFLVGLFLIAASGLPSLLGARRAAAGAYVGCAMMLAGAACVLVAAVPVLLGGKELTGGALKLPIGELALTIDALSAVFLAPILLIGSLGTIYGLSYWHPDHHRRSSATVRTVYGLLVASMCLVVAATDAITFLFAWEVMSLSAFAAISADDHRRAVRQAGWLYLVNTHLSVLVLFAMFAVWYGLTGSFALQPLEAGVSPVARAAVFLLAVVGFGCKAGMMPLHFWLPDAHANAPSHVSALLSGVVIKMGIYGLVRVCVALLPGPPLSWGVLVLVLGTISAVLGVAFALGQHDLKKLLAYHSIENIGIILMGLGIALIGAYAQRPAWQALGLAGCLLHTWNHGLFKSLLFLAAGGVIFNAHTRQIDQMGGRAKVMPLTALAFLVGAVAICGLPPLNGFISEWLVYLGLLGPLTGTGAEAAGGGGGYAVLGLVVPVLALVGALALACFVKVFGAVFLGEARSAAPLGREPGGAMLLPLGVLGGLCVMIGVFPLVGVAGLTPAVAAVTGVGREAVTAALAPVGGGLAVAMPIVAGVLALVVAAAHLGVRRAGAATAGTWDCGYARPTGRMQYTASSLAASILELFNWAMRPRQQRVRLTGVFPAAGRFHSHVADLVLDRCLKPGWRAITSLLAERRTRPQGIVQFYILYIFIALLVLLFSLMPWGQMWNWLLARGGGTA
jgi:hydrogenase-4 component B